MDELRRLVDNARFLVLDGYYDVEGSVARCPSFLETLGTPEQPSDVIVEVKYASPTMETGQRREDFDELVRGLLHAGPLGLSVLAEPRIFGGGLDLVRRAATKGVPVLMKDVVVDPAQIEAAAATGASTVLLIETLFSRDPPGGASQELIDVAHGLDLDVILEVHTLEEWDAAASTEADILGINNRDLASMAVDLGTVPAILRERSKDRPVIAMSGVETRAQVADMLRAGADAVLVGTSVMRSEDPPRALEALLHD